MVCTVTPLQHVCWNLILSTAALRGRALGRGLCPGGHPLGGTCATIKGLLGGRRVLAVHHGRTRQPGTASGQWAALPRHPCWWPRVWPLAPELSEKMPVLQKLLSVQHFYSGLNELNEHSAKAKNEKTKVVILTLSHVDIKTRNIISKDFIRQMVYSPRRQRNP